MDRCAENACDDAGAEKVKAVQAEDGVVAKLDVARIALYEAKTMQGVKHIADMAKAAEVYAKQQKLGDEAIGYAHSIKIEALRRLGKMLLASEKNTGNAGTLRGRDSSGGAILVPPENTIPPYAEIGLDKKQAHVAQKLAELPEEQLEQVRTGAVTVSEAINKIKLDKARLKYATSRTQPGADVSIVRASAAVWLDSIPNKSADLLITDPPYSTDVDDLGAFVKSWLIKALDKVKRTGRAYVFIGAYPRELLCYLQTALPDQVLVWSYENTLGPSAVDRYNLNWQAVLYYKNPQAPDLKGPDLKERWAVHRVNAPDGRIGNRVHRWQKPDELAERLILQSTEPGAVILDPFAGSGTFCYAAGRLGRRAIGCDIEWNQQP